jgi:hypothetical protein
MSDRTPTAARPTSRKDAHFYGLDGTPQYQVIGKTTGKPRPPTIRDARKNNWLPGVSNVLKCLHKEGLVNYLIEQSVLAALTTPQLEGEQIDSFIYRVLHTEKVQEQESEIARDTGKEIHSAIEDYFQGVPVPDGLAPWIMPAIRELEKFGQVAFTEKILIGDGYAGKTDLGQDCPQCWRLWDIKSTKNLPKGAWPEHRLQLSAYAKAFADTLAQASDQNKPIVTANIYISTVDCGQFVIAEHEEWLRTYMRGFAPLVTHWQWANDYVPEQLTAERYDDHDEPPPNNYSEPPAARAPVTEIPSKPKVVMVAGVLTKTATPPTPMP